MVVRTASTSTVSLKQNKLIRFSVSIALTAVGAAGVHRQSTGKLRNTLKDKIDRCSSDNVIMVKFCFNICYVIKCCCYTIQTSNNKNRVMRTTIWGPVPTWRNVKCTVNTLYTMYMLMGIWVHFQCECCYFIIFLEILATVTVAQSSVRNAVLYMTVCGMNFRGHEHW